MAIMATLQKKCDFWIWRNVSEYEENVISVNFGKVWEWIPMYHQLWKETDFVSHVTSSVKLHTRKGHSFSQLHRKPTPYMGNKLCHATLARCMAK